MEVTSSRANQTIRAALNGLSARGRVIADNVANVDTPGFKASQVNFEAALRSAVSRSGETFKLAAVPNMVAPAVPSEPAAITPTVVQLNDVTLREDGNNVDIDQQMVSLAETNLNYNALTQLMSQRLGSLRTIINDGRR